MKVKELVHTIKTFTHTVKALALYSNLEKNNVQENIPTEQIGRFIKAHRDATILAFEWPLEEGITMTLSIQLEVET